MAHARRFERREEEVVGGTVEDRFVEGRIDCSAGDDGGYELMVIEAVM